LYWLLIRFGGKIDKVENNQRHLQPQEKKVQILLTNDDGVHSPGLKSLALALQSLGHVTVVAPATEQSGISHALTFRTPLFVREVNWDGMKVWAVEGTPADCTRIGVLNLCEQRPDIIVSGLNQGLNIGCNTVYSGTIAGAEEGAMLGIDSFAVSLEYDKMPPWDNASVLVTQVIRQILEAKIVSDRADLININVPLSACYTKQSVEVCVVPVDQTPLVEMYSTRQTPYGESYYWLTGRITPNDPKLNTDRIMVKKGYVTVTPLEYNRTNRTAIEKLELAFVDKSNESPVSMFPETVGTMEELLKPDVVRNYPPQAFRDDMTNTGVSPTPLKSDTKGTNDNSSSYSDGT
jgi:5'-nucleotidase